MMTTKKTRTTTTKTERHRGQRGVALLLVVWTFAMLAVLAAEFARAMRDEAASTRNFKEGTVARYLAMAGISEAILALRANREQAEQIEKAEDDQNLDPVRSLAQGDGQWVKAEFNGKAYQVRVLDEGGKIGLNAVDDSTLRLLLTNLQLSGDVVDTITDSIVDWRDPDDLHGVNGAESDYYESLPRPYRAKNGDFDTVEELLLVRGVDRELFYGNEEYPGLGQIFSVFNGQKKVNPASATPAVMQALLGMGRNDAEELARQRRSGAQTPDDLSALLAGSPIGGEPKTPVDMTIEARVLADDERTELAHVGAVVHMDSGGGGLRVYRWYDSILASESDHAGMAGTSGEEEVPAG